MTIALWCVLVAGLMPYFTVVIAKAGNAYDNRNPRDWAGKIEGFRKRAYAAHQNHFEAFALFGVAVLAAELKETPQTVTDGLALLFVVARLGYTATYLADLPTLRSLFWAVGIGAALALLSSPAWA